MAKPIFVIGKNRSGTKWLSNIIANHPDVACIQREGAGGILETNMLSTFTNLFGDLSYIENYFGMVVCFSETNFFKLTGLDKEILFKKKYKDCFCLFRQIMNLYAQKKQKTYWLQKASVTNLPQVYNAFPDARFIIIERKITDNIRSSRGLAKLNNGPMPGILRETAKWHLAKKTVNKYKGKDNIMHMKFEQLKNDRETSVKRVCSFLDLDFNESLLQEHFKKNTSFQQGIKKEDVLSPLQTLWIKVLNTVWRFMPYFLLNRVGSILSRADKVQRLVSKTFLLLRKEYGWGNNDV